MCYDQDAPVLPRSPVPGSPPRPRRRIESRSLSRESKPASLKLTISNGSTATVPPTPAFPARSESLPSSAIEEKDLPPPPPAKSERRKSVKQSDAGSQSSRPATDLARNDSLLSQGESRDSTETSTTTTSSVIGRKAVPDQGLKKFKSLAELNNGPRGRKGAPMPPTSAPRTLSVDSQRSDAVSRKGSVDSQANMPEAAAPQPAEKLRKTEAELPPTPEEEQDTRVPAPPKKVFTGLPSNPRIKAPASPLHFRGKSSTGFNVLKAMRPAPPIPTMELHTITPEMTPSPTLKPVLAKKDAEISPVSPLPPPKDERRPFSFEPAVATTETQQKSTEQEEYLAMSELPLQSTTPPAETRLPMRTTSLDPPEPSPGFQRPTSAPSSRPTSSDLQDYNLSPFPGPSVPTSPVDGLRTEPTTPPTPPPFEPLTRRPIPLPVSYIPRITPAQLSCYTRHCHNIWSNNIFQPMGCMVCHENDKDRKWACTWCQLRICRSCSEDLRAIPGRDLGTLIQKREKGEVMAPGMKLKEDRFTMVVEDIDGEERGEGMDSEGVA
ncbi:uncharacterized protein J4E87_007303 [Alternaria ethzedia]|uniref:uncharacterized protein n=1 Tax=Alternaria ethzedia TaxID=181014 RepID=UPI0020C554A9|nr:uncharacterized protein J4E87_007303 [Alternaria ethzedia]KAI4620615.1 hypothetical protein J4E87_007303 [Alternaria ethzedia]